MRRKVDWRVLLTIAALAGVTLLEPRPAVAIDDLPNPPELVSKGGYDDRREALRLVAELEPVLARGWPEQGFTIPGPPAAAPAPQQTSSSSDIDALRGELAALRREVQGSKAKARPVARARAKR